MSVKRVCKLLCINDSHEPIILPDNEEVILGRGPDTKIKDMKCSRTQVSLLADTNSMTVVVKQLGPNKSGVNGLALKQDAVATLIHGDRLELLLGCYVHSVEFDPHLPKEARPVSNGLKRPLDEPQSSGSNKLICYRSDDEVQTSDTGPSTESKWESIANGKLLIYTSKGVIGRSKIASYDLDFTLISTQSGRVFPKDTNDWRIAFPEVPGKLKQLWNSGHKIVLFTNQAGIGRGKIKVADFKTKLERVIAKLGVPVQAFVSTGNGLYRKPAPEMWNVLVEKKNGGVAVSLADSLYCGDAAGRGVNWAPKKKKDFSSSDRLMALNVGVPFFTPEEHFLGWRPAPFVLPAFNPSALGSLPLCDPSHASVTSDQQEVVVLVGSPGSGKSHFASTHLVPEGYEHINRDVLGSWQRCLTALEQALSRGHSVVVDNTNPDRESRGRFLQAARTRRVPCRCFVMAVGPEHARHNNKFREFTDDSHQMITDMVINMYKSKYEEPKADEGFDAILKINFVPKFNNVKLEKLYKMYLLEK